MVVCKFFQQGNCRFGDNCRNEHPRNGGTSFGGSNRFGALSNQGNSFGNFNGNRKPSEWSIEAPQVETIRLELGKERPKWVLSAYGAVKNTPGSLFEGNEYSPEEIRFRFYEMAAKGQEAQADQEASQLWNKAEKDMDNALNHVNDVRPFMESCEQKHPNRYDFLSFDGSKTRDEHANAVQTSQSAAASSGFGTGNAFGQPAANNSNPFGKPAAATFGQPAGPSAFGGAGGAGAGAFGKPAQPSAFGQSGFGSTAQPTSTAFGQPAASNAFGKPAFGAPGFGQTAFGQSAQPAQQTSAFGQSANPSAFGTPGFGSSSSTAFGKPAQPTSTFGQPPQTTSAFGQTLQPTSTFGQPSQTTSAFGQAAQSTSTFGQPLQPTSAFGQAAQSSPAFGQSGGPSFGQNGFGQSAFGQATAQPSSNASPFGAPTSSAAGFGTAAGSAGFGRAVPQSASPFASQPANAAVPEVSMDSDTPVTSQPPAPKVTLTNAFGSTNTWKSDSTPSSTLAFQPTQADSTTIPVAATQSTKQNTSETPQTLLGKPPAPLVYTQTLPQGPTQSNASRELSTFRGQPVRYLPDTSLVNPGGTTVPCYNRPDGKGAERIWFSGGAATQEVAALLREDKVNDLQAPVEEYTDEVKATYKTIFETGRFEPGKMPHIPPMREWTAYDF